jgi:hypothetical protein
MEFSMQINSGAFFYGGQSTRSTSTDISYPPYSVKNPYGRTPGFSFGVSSQFQKITDNKFIYGLGIGYESLSSKVNLKDVWSEEPVYPWVTSECFATLTNQFINLNPYVGHRIVKSKVTFDIIIGTDLGIGLKSQAKLNLLNSRGDSPIVRFGIDKTILDFRPRIGITSFYKNLGLSISYSHGLSNYAKDNESVDGKIYSRYFRFGLLYRLRT